MISKAIEVNQWLAPLFALLAGILTSFTPCSLSSIPLIIGYVGGTGQRDTRKSFLLSLIFALGSAITFTSLGALASVSGMLFNSFSTWWYIFLGTLMVLMSLQIWGVFEIIPSSYLISKNKYKGFAGAFLAGVLGGIFSSPCSTPVLVVLLAIVAGKGALVWGMILLFIYSIGHGILAIIAGTSVGMAHNLSKNHTYNKFRTFTNVALGMVVLFIGLYMFYIGF